MSTLNVLLAILFPLWLGAPPEPDTAGTGTPPAATGSAAANAAEDGAAHAADDDVTKKELGEGLRFEEQVVVTAGRTEQKLRDLPVQVTVLAADEIRRSPAQTVADVLLQVPGFNLQRAQSSRTATPPTQAVSLRSMGSSGASRSLVLVDGVPLNDPFFGWVAWSQISLSSVESIEVVPAGGATAWGNQALSGVISIITRRPHGSTVDLDSQVGSLRTVDVDLGGSHAMGPVSVSARGTYFDTDGYTGIPQEVRGPIDTNSASDTRLGEGRLEYNPSPGRRWVLQGSHLDDHRTTGSPLSQDDSDVTTVRVGGDLTTQDSGLFRMNVFGQRRRATSTRGSANDERTAETPSRDQFDIPSGAVGAGLTWARPVSPRHHLTAGTDFQWTEGEVSDDSRYVTDHFTRRSITGGQQVLFGAYAQDVAALGSRWRLTAGGRLDLWHSFDGKDYLQDLDSGEVLQDESFPSRSVWIFSPSLGVVHRASDRIGLRAAAYQTFRAPTPNELFKPFQTSARTITEANADLRPEKVVVGVEAGFDYLAGRFSSRVSGFWNEIEDAITEVTIGTAGSRPEEIEPCGLVPARGNCRQKQNIDRVRNRGAELEVQFRPQRAWRFAAGYVHARSTVTSAPNDPVLEGKRLRRVPEHQASLRAEFLDERILTASLQGRYLGERYQNDLNTILIADSIVVDLFVSRRVNRRLELFASVENLFDAEFEVDNGSDGPELGHPRIVHGGLRFRWSGGESAAASR